MESGIIAPSFMASSLDGGEWSASRFDCFTSGERAPGIHWVGGWVGPSSGLDAVDEGKISYLLPGMESRPSSPQPVAIPAELNTLCASRAAWDLQYW
jgi:hypothetical protein